MRLSRHPGGLAPRIANYQQCRAHLTSRLRRQIGVTADPFLVSLLEEIDAYPEPKEMSAGPATENEEYVGIVTPMQITTDDGILSLLSTTTVFGSPVDITLSELAIEAFFPADARSREMLRNRRA